MKSSATHRRPATHGVAVASLLILTNCAALAAAGVLLAWSAGNGEREWATVLARMRDAGYSLNIAEIAAAPLPEAGNFGATPALQGIGTSPERQPAGTKDRLAALRRLDPRKSDENPSDSKAPAPVADQPLEWKAWRTWLSGEMGWDVPTREPDAAKAVLAALQRRGIHVMPELIAAARSSRHSQLIPPQRSRVEAAGREDPEMLRGIVQCVLGIERHALLGMEASIASEDSGAAAAYSRVAFCIEDLMASEVGLLPALVSATSRKMMREAVRRGINIGRMNPDLLQSCQEHLASRPLHPIFLKAFEMENAVTAAAMTDPPEHGAFFGELSKWQIFLFRLVARANMATLCSYFLDDARFLKTGDWAGLLRAQKARSEDTARATTGLAILLNADRIFADGADLAESKLLPELGRQEMERQAVIVACAVARHRLITGRLPEALTDLPKELLPQIPKDLDDQPIRYRQLSAGWVIWSIGTDMEDDWHGDPPPESWLETHKEDPAPARYPDWQWHFTPKPPQ